MKDGWCTDFYNEVPHSWHFTLGQTPGIKDNEKILLFYNPTHWISRPTEFPEWLRCIGAMDLKDHAGSGTQLGHHTLQVARGNAFRTGLLHQTSSTKKDIYTHKNRMQWLNSKHSVMNHLLHFITLCRQCLCYYYEMRHNYSAGTHYDGTTM